MSERLTGGVSDHKSVKCPWIGLVLGDSGHEFLIHQEAFAVIFGSEFFHVRTLC